MSRHVVLGLLALVALSACSPKSADSTASAQTAGDFTVATQFAPDPPKQGPETITVTVKDAGGNLVKGATVSIVTDMPSMSMAGPKLALTDNGDGTYAAQTNLNYGTTWTFAISVAAGGKTGTAHLTEEVK